jgi:hypothetical protein
VTAEQRGGGVDVGAPHPVLVVDEDDLGSAVPLRHLPHQAEPLVEHDAGAGASPRRQLLSSTTTER